MAGEKRTKDSDEFVRTETTILLDIEGTTTNISFVEHTLFSFIRENLKYYVDEKWDQADFKNDLEKLKEQAKKDSEAKVAGFVPIIGASPEEEKVSLLKNVLWQMDEDRKTGALKQLQGHMWRQAYESGAVKGHVYEDVPKALESWTDGGRKVYIYSSGSVEAQKLLFSHSQNNDLSKYISGFYDTEVGGKQEAASYKNVLNKLDVPASSVLFLTDVVKEAQAAKEAGISTVIVIREANAPLSDEEKSAFITITSFDELSFQSSSKRQKRDDSDVKNDGVIEESDNDKNKNVADEKTETEKIEVGGETVSSCEPMEISEDVLEVITKKTESAKSEESEVVVEGKQNAKEKVEIFKPTKVESEEEQEGKLIDGRIKELKVAPAKTEVEHEEAVVVDKPEKVVSIKETVQKVETPLGKTKLTLSEDKKEIKTEFLEVKAHTSEIKIDEPKVDTEGKFKSNKKSVKSEITEEKVEKPTEDKAVAPKEETNSEARIEKIPEIVIEKVPEVEEENAAEIIENGGIMKTAGIKEKKGSEAQPELRSAKPEDETQEKIEISEKAKAIESSKVKTDEEVEVAVEGSKKKLNGTSNGEEKQASDEAKHTYGDVKHINISDTKQINGEEKHSNGVEDKEKLNSKSTGATASQNGEAETLESSDAIKVKKVVDSTIADGAGEPEVVASPLAVAATS